MGWKAVKDHYAIPGAASVRPLGDKIIISIDCQAHPQDALIIDCGGKIAHNGLRLQRQPPAFEAAVAALLADPSRLGELVAAQDQFKADLPVFTYAGATIVEKRCEIYGWPNMTHDGEVMYENTHHHDRNVVIRWATKNAAAGAELTRRHIQRLTQELEKANADLRQFDADQQALRSLAP